MREAVIVSSVRTPGGRAKRGGLADTRSDVLARTAVKGCLAKVEQVKPARERGLYLHPELYGQPETLAVDREPEKDAQNPQTRK